MEGAFPVAQPDVSRSSIGTFAPRALERLLDLLQRLPTDRKIGKKWRFVGLRGPIETAMLRLATAPDSREAALATLDAVVNSLDRVDRNRGFRKSRVSWKPLPVEWVPSLFNGEKPSVEARLAMAMVAAFPVSRPFALYRFGVEWNGNRFEHPEQAPARWVWGPNPLPRVLSAVLARRTHDWESESRKSASGREPVRLEIPARIDDVNRWLNSQLDEESLERWISRLALFDWRRVPNELRSLASPESNSSEVSGALCLFGLFQALFDLRRVGLSSSSESEVLDPDSGARTPGAARTLAVLIRAGQLGAAVQFVSNRYAMSRTRLSRTSVQWNVDDPERLFASLLFTVSDLGRRKLIERWLRPQRRRGDEAHV
jgi:CRISPR-associated protein Csx17